MEEATVHAVDSLGGSGPGWLFAAGVLVIVALVAIRAFPVWKEVKLERLAIEREREQRKAEEARMRDARDRENCAISARQVDAQDRSTAAINAMTASMESMRHELDISRAGSKLMGDRIDGVAHDVGTMAHQVDEIHGIVVRKD